MVYIICYFQCHHREAASLKKKPSLIYISPLPASKTYDLPTEENFRSSAGSMPGELSDESDSSGESEDEGN